MLPMLTESPASLMNPPEVNLGHVAFSSPHRQEDNAEVAFWEGFTVNGYLALGDDLLLRMECWKVKLDRYSSDPKMSSS